jgi:small subunit ribosomal protein S3
MIERKFIADYVEETGLRDFLKRVLAKAGVSDVEIQKTPLTTRIIVHVERPGLVIGRKGKNVQDITTLIKEQFSFDNPQIEVEAIGDSRLDPNIIALRIMRGLEKGIKAKRIVVRTIAEIMKAGAVGAEIILSGKIVGKGGKARSERAFAGYLAKAGEPRKLVSEAKKTANTKAGVIGITVKIVKPGTHFPDKLNIKELLTHGDSKDESDKGNESAGEKGKTKAA